MTLITALIRKGQKCGFFFSFVWTEDLFNRVIWTWTASSAQHPASWHHFTSTAVRRKREREGRLKIAPSLPPHSPTLTYSLSLTSSSAFFISPLLRFSCSCSLHPDNHFIYFLLTSFCRGCWSDSWPVLITGGGKGHVSTKWFVFFASLQ